MSHPTVSVPGTPHRTRALYGGAPPAPPRTLLDILDATAARHPGAPALDAAGEVLTYRALCDETARRAAFLHRAGIGPGDRVGVLAPLGRHALRPGPGRRSRTTGFRIRGRGGGGHGGLPHRGDPLVSVGVGVLRHAWGSIRRDRAPARAGAPWVRRVAD
ncbi:hypothetical protein B7P34_18555 [Streptosporangium nondiastaticum]|uniref:AMP-dependent synthetase/ligase domain-containing protein n=1 Tax=Streptosporangium nondiastaticum TaxID=35764 RepID=A0A9X7PGP7_9ACTN|nr:AMP-binding protein [Streptosporangium nondiastaticum]PSJ27248.1 hypothetical protein B7P34_18555 [Streptosporangium nondiastaticum]